MIRFFSLFFYSWIQRHVGLGMQRHVGLGMQRHVAPITFRGGIGAKCLQLAFLLIEEDGAMESQVAGVGRIDQAGGIVCAHLEDNAHGKFAESFAV